MAEDLKKYASLLGEIKSRIGQAQTRAVFSANREMLALYWDIGRMITERQKREGWGRAVIPRLSRDLRNELPGLRGFSERNIDHMLRFYREYPSLFIDSDRSVDRQDSPVIDPISQTPSAKLHHVEKKGLNASCAILQSPIAKSNEARISRIIDTKYRITPPLVAKLPWSHNILLIQSVKDIEARVWYMQQTILQGWSCNTLQLMIKSQAHLRQAGAVTNFEASLPAPQSDLSRQTLKDPCIFDFLTLDTPFREKELEAGLLQHLERFLLELGKGFFQLKHDTDNPSIGLILCRDRKKLVAEYALRGMVNPIGISEYGLTRALPENLASALPTIEEIEGAVGDGDE